MNANPETDPEILELADDILDFIRNCKYPNRYYYQYPIPSIQYIDGLALNSSISFCKQDDRSYIRFHMNDKYFQRDLLTQVNDDNRSITSVEFDFKFNLDLNKIVKEVLIDDLSRLINTINNFFYDKYSNILTTSKKRKIVLCSGKFLNPKLTADCCVCLELTTNKTRCNHLICLQCIYALNSNACPMCRKKLYHQNESDDDDDEDDE